MIRVLVGASLGDRLLLTLPTALPDSEGSCRVGVQVSAAGFTGSAAVDLEIAALAGFADGLERVESTLVGEAVLESRDGLLIARCEGNGLGRVTVDGGLSAGALAGTRLEFTFELDRSVLPEPLLALREFLAAQQWAND